MHEILDKVIEFCRAVLRFRWTVLLVAWIVAVVGWAAVYQLPEKYTATARVFVDSNRILKPLLQGIAIQPDVDERVGLMSKTLLNRPNLEKLMRMSDLDIRTTTDYEKEQLLSELGRTVKLSAVRGNSSLYNVGFSHEDPLLAKRVVQSLLTIFIESTLGNERKDSQNAQQFLDRQIVDYEQRLLAAERRLSAFKRNNSGKMPGEAGGYYQRLDSAISAERSARLELREAENRRNSLRLQLRDERPTIPEGDGVNRLSPIDAQLRMQTEELSTLLVRYTERHPRVSQLRDSIAALEARKARDAREGRTPESAPSYSLVPNPVYQELRSLLAEAEARVSELEVRVADYAGQVVELNATIDSIPKVEAELQELDRDYTIIKEQYETLLERRESARLSEKVEQNADDVKFRVIDPPFVPSRPASDRVMFSAAVMVVAIGAGAALAFALAILWPVFYTADAVAARTGRPVIGTVSRQRGEASRLPATLDWIVYVGMALLLGAVFALLMAIYLGIIDREQLEPLLSSRLGPVIESALNATVELVKTGSRWVGKLTGVAGE